MHAAQKKNLDAFSFPILFASNAGQWPEQVKFKADMAGGYTIWFESNRLLIDARGSNQPPLEVVLTEFCDVPVVSEKNSTHFSNYYLGNDSTKWHEGVPSASSIRYRGIAEGVDLVFYSNSRKQLEFDYELAPGASLSQIQREFIGSDSIVRESNNKLAIYFAGIVLHESIPVSYAIENNASVPFEVQYLVNDEGVTFAANDDEMKNRVVDPVLYMSAYLGGNGADELLALEPDNSNGFWTIGSTQSINYPILDVTGGVNDPDPNNDLDGESDVVVTRVSGNGDVLLWSTYLGGSNFDEGSDMAFDQPIGTLASADFDVYLTGRTRSSDFPRTTGQSYGGSNNDDAFVTVLTGDFGRLVWSRFYGGVGNDIAYGIAVTYGGSRTFITGVTNSTNLPISQSPFPPPLQSGWDGSANSAWDAFAASFSVTGEAEYSTYLNGGSISSSGDDYAYDIELSNDTAYIVGATSSQYFANDNNITFNGVFRTHTVGLHPYVIALNGTGNVRTYATYLGHVPHDTDLALCIEMGNDGHMWVGGTTFTGNFMQQFADTISTYKQFADGGDSDAWLIRFNHTLQQVFSWTFLGGDSSDAITDLQVDDLGNVYFGGHSASDNVTNMGIRYPLVHPPSGFNGANNRGGTEGMIDQFSNTGRTLHFFTLYGGAGDDEVQGVAFGANGRGFACGVTASNSTTDNFPVLSPTGTFSWQGGSYRGGASDGFIASWNCCTGMRGNVDGSEDETPDIGDLTYLVDHLLITYLSPPCFQESNVDAIFSIDFGDLTLLVDHLFIGLQPLPNCE